MNIATKLDEVKTCSCGIVYAEIPVDAVTYGEGVWWNCSCNSTLFHTNLEKYKSRLRVEQRKNNEYVTLNYNLKQAPKQGIQIGNKVSNRLKLITELTEEIDKLDGRGTN